MADDWRPGAGIPRRSCVDLLEPIEAQARQLLLDVEALGAHPRLTKAVQEIDHVRRTLADWVDAGKPGELKP